MDISCSLLGTLNDVLMPTTSFGLLGLLGLGELSLSCPTTTRLVLV